MKAKVIFSSGNYGCAGGKCPTIYKTGNGNFILQGYKLSSEDEAAFQFAKNENLIELPKEFVEAFIKSEVI